MEVDADRFLTGQIVIAEMRVKLGKIEILHFRPPLDWMHHVRERLGLAAARTADSNLGLIAANSAKRPDFSRRRP